MALSFTTQSIVIDESFDLTDNDISLAQFATDEPALYAHLITSNDFPKSNAGDLPDPEIAWQSDFLSVTVPVGTTLNDITFAQNSAGLAFSTTLGVASGMKTVDGSDIWLFADPSNENVLLGRVGADGTVAASGDVAFAIVLDEAADHSSAGLYIVQYAALYNPDGTNPDDRLSTLTDKIFISADSTAPILFSDFADVPSGNTDFAIIAPDSAGVGQSGDVQLLVTGFDGDGNATVNVSGSGLGAASQSIGVDAMLQIDFVTGATQGTGTANQIAYGTHYETQEAGFKVTQINPTNSGPNPNRVDVQIGALNVTGDEQGLNFYDGSATSAVTITRVQVLAADGVTIVEDTQAGGADDATITIAINGATADIKNLLLNQSVRFYTSDPMDRFTAKNIDTASNTSFDLGGFYFTGTQENSDYKEVGSLLGFDDGAPFIEGGSILPILAVDESALPSGNGEAGANTTASADFSSLFIGSGGPDATPDGIVYTLETLGGASGLIDSLTGNAVNLAMNGADIVGQVDDGGTLKTVFTISVSSAGIVTFTQERAVNHADSSNPDDSTGFSAIENLITLKASIADGDTDGDSWSEDITSAFAIEDDGPTLSIGQDMFALVVDESSLSSGSDAAGTEESATFDISSMITGVFGADGAGTRTLDLALHGGATELDSGLVDTLTGHTVWLFKEGDDIVGREGVTAATASEEAIRVTLNAGTVGFSLSRAIVHPDGSNPDDRLTLGENLIDLVATIMDSDKDPLSGMIDLGPHLAIDDDGPSVTGGSVAAGVLNVDETHLTAATNGIDGSDPNAAATSATLMGAALFSKIFGADGPYGGEDKIGYALAIAADGAPTGLYDTASKAEILLKVNAEGTLVTGYVAAGDVFTLALAADGTVTVTQLRAVMHGSADTPSDTSEAATLIGSGLISLLAGAQDGDTDKATTASVDLTGAIAFLDDGPTIGPVTPTDNNGTFNVRFMAGEDNVGTIGGVDGADGAVTSLVSVVDVSHESVKDSFDIVQNGNHVDFYLKGTMVKWFTFDLTDNVANPDGYNFTVLKDGVTQNEDLNFKIKAGPPVETLSVDSVFDNANIVFDGLIFGSVTDLKPIADPTLAAYNKGPGSAADDINPNNLGFGIKGTNPSQASQINNNEGFSAYLGEGVDNLTFGIQGIGNNAVGVQVEYWLYDDPDNNPATNGTPGNLGAALVHKTVDIDGLDAGNHLEYVTIDDQVTFDTVYVRFYYDASKGDLANSNKNILSNAGVRVQDFSIKNETTVPEYDFQFNVARTDGDESPIGTPTGDTVTTALTIHVDPDWMFS